MKDHMRWFRLLHVDNLRPETNSVTVNSILGPIYGRGHVDELGSQFAKGGGARQT
jgi:hypothetical protein